MRRSAQTDGDGIPSHPERVERDRDSDTYPCKLGIGGRSSPLPAGLHGGHR